MKYPDYNALFPRFQGIFSGPPGITVPATHHLPRPRHSVSMSEYRSLRAAFFAALFAAVSPCVGGGAGEWGDFEKALLSYPDLRILYHRSGV